MVEDSTNPFGAPSPGARGSEPYARWFELADSDGDGRVTGQDARRFFSRSGLAREQLARVWDRSDSRRRGYLGVDEFHFAMELCSLAQRRGVVDPDTLEEERARGRIPPPRMRGLEETATGSVDGGFGGGLAAPGSASSRESSRSDLAQRSRDSSTGEEAGGRRTVVPPAGRVPSSGSVAALDQVSTPLTASVRAGAAGRHPRTPAGPHGGEGGGGGVSPGALQRLPGAPPGPLSTRGALQAATKVSGKAEQLSLSSLLGKKPKPRLTMHDVTTIGEGLARIYACKVRSVEVATRFDLLHGPHLTPGDFAARPTVLLLGQYSVGKSTFVRFLLGRDYPGIHIGPEPTTDRFVAIEHGPGDRRTPGEAAAANPDRPWGGMASFGGALLSRFEVASCSNRLLEEITIVDTPGVLSGGKQRGQSRGYDFTGVCGWFAARADLILLLFDPHKLDVSDELKEVIGKLRGQDDKVRVVLNKADLVDEGQLLRVYGALMWSLARVLHNPEVVRVYVGSFRPEGLGGGVGRPRAEPAAGQGAGPHAPAADSRGPGAELGTVAGLAARAGGGVPPGGGSGPGGRPAPGASPPGGPPVSSPSPSQQLLFEREQEDLLHDLYAIPSRSCDRKTSELVKRVRVARTHALVMQHLRKQLPYFGTKKAQEKLFEELEAHFILVARENHLHPSDFPDPDRFRTIYRDMDLSKLPKLEKKDLKGLETALSIDVPQLIRRTENPYV